MALRIHAWAAVVWVGAIIVQVFLAGLAITNLGGSGDFSTHMDFGYNIGFIALIVLVLAIVAKRPRRDIGIAAAIVLLYIVQILLPNFKSVPAIAAVHPVNAMLLFGVSAWYARNAWRAASNGGAASATGAAR